MTINEALAIHAYWRFAAPGSYDEDILSRAWKTICEYAQPAIENEKKDRPLKTAK